MSSIARETTIHKPQRVKISCTTTPSSPSWSRHIRDMQQLLSQANKNGHQAIAAGLHDLLQAHKAVMP